MASACACNISSNDSECGELIATGEKDESDADIVGRASKSGLLLLDWLSSFERKERNED